MSWSERISKINRVQQSWLFKVVATGIILLAGLGVIIGYLVQQAAKANEAGIVTVIDQPLTDAEKAADAERRAKAEPGQLKLEDETIARQKSEMQTVASIVNRFREQSLSTGSVVVGVLGIMGVALAAVWLGLGLTYLGVLLLGGLIAGPMILIGIRGQTDTARSIGEAGKFGVGILTLALTFSTLVRGAGLLLGASHPITAIARNVLSEAVRMKISLVFIVMLIIGLAALPGMLDEGVPLRYKVQNFLQYGLGGSYLLTAVLVLFLASATLTYEQRDKIIWQTMTKPVKAWEYVLGKWLGVSVVAALLLGVSGTGVYLFTEYLRHQTAQGEVAPFVGDRSNPTIFSEDRFVLEFQVLSGRETVNPYIPPDDSEAIDREVRSRIAAAEALYKTDSKNPKPDVARIVKEVSSERLQRFLSIRPDQLEGAEYYFDNLQQAKALNMPMSLRYKVNAGNNAPTEQYRVTFLVGQSRPRVVTTPLAQAMTLPVYPKDIDEKGRLTITVYNGDVFTNQPNRETMTFSAGDGLQISYPVSAFGPNFMRAVLVLWLKLTFLAAIAICAGTFLSFSVATLVAFGVFLMAESAGFLSKAVENYSYTDEQRNVIWYKWVITQISENVALVFKGYADLSPTSMIVEGKYLPWASVFSTGLLLLALGTLLFAIGAAIFRQRELAMYSGQ